MLAPHCSSRPFHAVTITPDYVTGLLELMPPSIFHESGGKVARFERSLWCDVISWRCKAGGEDPGTRLSNTSSSIAYHPQLRPCYIAREGEANGRQSIEVSFWIVSDDFHLAVKDGLGSILVASMRRAGALDRGVLVAEGE